MAPRPARSTSGLLVYCGVALAGLLLWRARMAPWQDTSTPLPRGTDWHPGGKSNDEVLAEEVGRLRATVASLEKRLDGHLGAAAPPAASPAGSNARPAAAALAPAGEPAAPLEAPEPPTSNMTYETLAAFTATLLGSARERSSRAAGTSLPDGRTPYFLHLHKAGGTTVCHVARMSNELRAAKRNCNMAGDGPRTLADGAYGYGNERMDGNCAARVSEAKKTNVQIVAVERWLDAGTALKCRADFFFVTVLREPVRRIISHCRFEQIPSAEAVGWATKRHFPRHEPIQRGTAVVDNFYTRSLLGKDVYDDVGPGEITLQHAVEAMGVLAAFDAVLILETLDASFDQLFSRLGWCRPPDAELRQSFGAGDVSITFDEAQTAFLRDLNAPDIGLYNFAKELARTLEGTLPATPHRKCRAKQHRTLGGNGRP